MRCFAGGTFGVENGLGRGTLAVSQRNGPCSPCLCRGKSRSIDRSVQWKMTLVTSQSQSSSVVRPLWLSPTLNCVLLLYMLAPGELELPIFSVVSH